MPNIKSAPTNEAEDLNYLLTNGNQLLNLNDYETAEEKFLYALKHYPNNFQILFHLSQLYYLKKDFLNAELYLLKVIELRSNIAELYSVLGIVQKELGKFKQAEINYLQAIAINPNFYEAYYNLGILLYNQKKYESAFFYFNKVVELKPDFHLAYFNLANVLRYLKKYDDAITYYYYSLELKNDFADCYYNLAVVYEKKFDLKNALLNYEKAIKLNPDHCYAHWNHSLLLLLSGNFKEGFAEYEWRKLRNEYSKRIFYKPELKEKNVSNKIIFVYDDQGLGDTIQFVRYLKLLKEMNNVIIFECDKVLFPILNKINFIDFIVERSNTQNLDIDYDYHISLLSLPYYFETNFNSIPNKVPYLKADEDLILKWNKIISNKNYYKIGLIWAGNPNHERDEERSINLELFNSLFKISKVKFFSLQKITSKKIEDELNANKNILKLDINTFADTSAIIENLDLIISVDTSAAHLSGAMNKETWLLIHFYPDWRWMLSQSDSPWYPSVKLFRQNIANSWSEVILEIKKSLLIKIEN